jgi:hypothetical protein
VRRGLGVALAALALTAWAAAARAGSGGADGRFDTRSSAHFLLHQDVNLAESGGFYGSRRFEQEVLGELERAYASLDQILGLRPPRRLDVIIDDPGLFDQQFGPLFRFRAAGFYAGLIRVRGDVGLTDALARTLHHELVHAAYDAAAPSLVLPAWLNEGSAEWFEWRTAGKRGLSQYERAALVYWASQNALLPLDVLSQPTFARLPGDAARVAYIQSYGMVDFLMRKQGERSLPRFVDELLRSRDLSRALQRVYRLDLGELEARFIAELR